MSEFNIKTTWLEHSGGTKFYQVFAISRHTQGGTMHRKFWDVTVCHYGALKVLPRSGDRRPIASGQSVVYTDARAEDKLKEKVRKGYRIDGEQSSRPLNERDFREWLQVALKTETRDEVLKALGMMVDPKASPIAAEDEREDPVYPEETIKTPRVEPEGWGSW